MNRRLTALFLAAFIHLVSTNVQGQEPENPQSPDLDQILTWFPPDAEMLYVANGPIEVPEMPYEDDVEVSSLLSLQAWAWSLAGVDEGVLARDLGGESLLIAVEASRRFTVPEDLGMMPYEGCQVLIFDPAANDAVQTAADRALREAPQSIEVGSHSVAVYTETWESDKWNILIAHPRPGVVLCATNQEFLEEVLARMDEEHHDRAFPDTLPEWEHVDRQVAVWAIRHYDEVRAKTDPTSPLSPGSRHDSEAIGFVFSFDSDLNAATVRYLSDAEDAIEVLKDGWYDPDENLESAVQQIEPGVVGFTLPVDDESVGMFVFVLLYYLGHGICL